MERMTIFRARQGVLPEDFNRPQEAMRDSIDHVVKDAILDGRGWSDFAVLRTGTAEITVKPGRIYNEGAVHALEADVVIDLVTHLPLLNRKWVAIVGFGQSLDTDTQARNFLINATTRTTQPEQVPMQRLRACTISTVIGVDAPQPAHPLVDANNIIIAWALLGPTGVLSVALVEANRVPNTFREKLRTDDLFNWRDLVGPQIESLRSDLAAIKSQLSQRGDQRLLLEVAVDVARVKEALEMEDGYTSYDADRFLDHDESQMDDVNFLAKVEEGIRFSDEAANKVSLQVFNPINPDVRISNGFLLPQYTEVKGFEVGPYHESLAISQYTYQDHTMVQRTVSRTRIRYGESSTVCTNAQWWRSGHYDAVKGVFYKDGDMWTVAQEPGMKAKFKRLVRFWEDTYEEVYWDRIVVDHTIYGQQIGQTFLQGADRWLTSIGLRFTQKSNDGIVNIALAGVKAGAPDLDNVIAIASLDPADIQTSADGSIETKIPMPATWLEAGRRYALVITTAGDHHVAMAQGIRHAAGTFFVSVDGAYQMGTADKDLCFSLYYARFARARTTVELQPMSLSGGISDIDILAPIVRPESCDLTFEVNIAGVWHPLESVTSGRTVLYGLPPLLPFRAVFTGTYEVQPGINLVESVLGYSRPRTVFKHISKLYTLPVTSTFKVVTLLENYKEENHDAVIRIRANGVGPDIEPATIVDEEMDPAVDPRSPAHKRIKRISTWLPEQITEPMNAVRIVVDGTTTSALDTWHVGERIHLAF